MNPEEVAAHTILTRVLEPVGGRLARPGRFHYRAEISPNPLVGEFDVVIRVVDEQDNAVTTATWQTVTFGNSRPGSQRVGAMAFGIDWTADRP